MSTESNILLPGIKFLTSECEHICRLCFASTEIEEVALDDSIKLQKYLDDTVTFLDMFSELSVLSEPSLPQVLCVNCATMTINSYLFKKLCELSQNNWSKVLETVNLSIKQTDLMAPNTQTVYLIVKDNLSHIITSKKRNIHKSKKSVINKLKEVFNNKSKQPSQRVRQRNSSVICEECGERFSSKCHLAKHMRVHSEAKHPCKQCPKMFATQLQLEEHTERVHLPKKISCSKCSKLFSTNKMLKHHDKLHHMAAVCRLCFIQFPSKKDLRTHLDKHEVNKCPRCGKCFLNKYTFKFHLKICGNLEERKLSFFCDICDKGYARKNGLRTHMKTDHGFGTVLSCNWCGKKFDAISRLRNHVVKHTKEKKFHCTQCGGNFGTRAALVYHTRLHTGERPFPCDLCNESFLSASRRMEHKRRKHFGPTKECTICHVKFLTGYQLRKHVQRHYNPQSKLFVPVQETPYNMYITTDD